jgi:hypothetical protein
MAKAPCVPVPSPRAINDKLFPEGVPAPPQLPPVWTAQVLLTPFGGQKDSTITPSDQLVIANVTYDATDPNERFMRIGLYLFESLYYYDFLFRSAAGQTQSWWLVSDPGDPNGPPAKSFGPFTTDVSVPPRDFLAANNFAHAGAWDVLGRSCDAFSAHRSVAAGTWFWFESEHLTRIMNVDIANDFKIPVLGAYYFVDLPTIERLTSSRLRDVYKECATATGSGSTLSAMVTQAHILLAMSFPPSGAQVECTLEQIQALLPAIAPPPRGIKPPVWTDRVNSECVMIGQETQAYYSQVWYDWGRGAQVTVLVRQPLPDRSYSQRLDDFLPKGAPGPSIAYVWDGAQWTPQCCDPENPGVGMPYPNFVERGKGICRAIFDDSRLGKLSIWSAPFEDEKGMSNFWFWFNQAQQGIIFSRAPAPSLTIIDYQTFVQNGSIAACVLDNPCPDIPVCKAELLKIVRSRPRFVPFGHGFY